MSADLEAAWSDLHDAMPHGWFVGRSSYRERIVRPASTDQEPRPEGRSCPLFGHDAGRRGAAADAPTAAARLDGDEARADRDHRPAGSST